ncbi:MAG: DUF5666 domain-containing protein [Actinomycetota bacterium]|nr:DUF5666 domain-containing protein [Actinomycetota bacterium]
MPQITRTVRRHVGASIAGGVAVVALAGGGIAYAATSLGPSAPAKASAPATSAPTTTPPAAGPARGHKTKHPGVRGTVTAVNGDAWTVTTAKGASTMVTITAQTAFGTKQAPSSAASFPVGTKVRVVGQSTGASITATRIVVPKAAGAGGSTPSTTAAS